MPLPVIPALFKEMAEQRRKKKVPRSAVAERCRVTEQTVERWESLTHLPLRAKEADPGGDLARAVDGYSEVTDKSPFDLWTAAINRATRERKRYEATLKTQGPSRTPSPRTKQAVGALRRQKKK
jgi:hypothetical protein